MEQKNILNNLKNIQYIYYKQQYIDNIKYINVSINILSNCNLHCEYCYNKEFRKKYNILLNLNSVKKYLNKSLLNNINIDILGGEPTLHPELYSFCEYLENNKQIAYVNIFSNGLKSIEYYAKFAKFKKIFFTISIHEQLLFNIQKIKQFIDMKNIQQVKIMFLNKKLEQTKLCIANLQFDKKIKLFYITDENYIYNSQYINYYNTVHNSKNYVIDSDLIFVDNNGNKININNENYLYYDTLKNFNLYHWKCYAGKDQFYINVDGKVSYCESYFLTTRKYFGTIYDSIIKFPKGILCPFTTCWCPSLSKKERVLFK